MKLNAYFFGMDGVLIDTGAPKLLKVFKLEAYIAPVVKSHFHEDHAAYLQQGLN